MADLEVNKQGLVINGTTKNAGDTITELDAGKQLNALRSAGIIKEVGLSKNQAYTDGGRFKGIDRTSVEGESVGTGDDTQTTFTLNNTPVIGLTETIFIDSTEQTRDTDYTIDYSIGEITFTTAPASGESITADYKHHIVLD